MKIQLLRHATLIVNMKGLKILIDPMLSPANTMEPVQKSPNPRSNPLVELPLSEIELSKLLESVDAVLVTHLHRDHFDDTAFRLIPKDTPILCQPEDEAKLQEKGFMSVSAVSDSLLWKDINFIRTGGKHGNLIMRKAMGTVSGFILKADGEPLVYIAGDTIWCCEVKKALSSHRPDIIIVNAGAAQFLNGGPITMTAEDVGKVCLNSAESRVVAVHMEAFNHCLLSRGDLREYLGRNNLASRVLVPEDGELMEF